MIKVINEKPLITDHRANGEPGIYAPGEGEPYPVVIPHSEGTIIEVDKRKFDVEIPRGGETEGRMKIILHPRKEVGKQ